MLTSFIAFISNVIFVAISYVFFTALVLITAHRENIGLFWEVVLSMLVMGITSIFGLILGVIVYNIWDVGSFFWLGIKITIWLWWIYYIATRPIVLAEWIKEKKEEKT